MKIEIKIKDLNTFYAESEILEETGNPEMYRGFTYDEDRGEFIGLPLQEIGKYKYHYPIKENNPINEDLYISGSKIIKKYDDIDGDEMNVDRFNDNLPFLEKNQRNSGRKQGKFINIYVNICENCNITAEDMLFKAISSVYICDLLESMGYRITIYCRIEIADLGSYREKKISYVECNLPLKFPDHPINKGLLATTLSPWFFRYWWFRFLAAKCNTHWSLGYSPRILRKSTLSDIYILSGECLSHKGLNIKLWEIKELFDIQDVED